MKMRLLLGLRKLDMHRHMTMNLFSQWLNIEKGRVVEGINAEIKTR